MVAVKGKSSTFQNRRLGQDNINGDCKSVGIRNFKVYSEIDKLKLGDRDSIDTELQRKSDPVNKGISRINGSHSKGCLENLDKGKGKRTSPLKTNVGRKVLADVTNENHDKGKGKRTSPLKTNIGRKVLADVTNARRNFFRNEVNDGSKQVKGKSDKITSSQRFSVGPGTGKAIISSSKPFVGNVRGNLCKATDDCHTLKGVVTKDLKVSSDDWRTKKTDGRTTARNLLPPIRKSLPALKQINQVDSRDGVKEENPGHSEKDRGKYGFPVKPKVGRKVAPRVSSGRNHLWRHRVSDGSMIMAPQGQQQVDVQALLVKSGKTIVKTIFTASNTQRTLKSNCTSRVSKSTSSATTSFKKKVEVVKSSTSGIIPSIVMHEQPAQGDFPAVGDSNLDKSSTYIIARRKPDHRKSYTSLLMARPKLLENHSGVVKHEKLPNIDDDCNHLEVAEYVDDIYQYYWVMEAQSQPLASYMAIQKDITPQMRGILINWLIEVHLKFDLMQETLYLMVTLLDQYLAVVSIKKNEMQLVGLTSLLLASKYEDFWHPRVIDLISISAEAYTKDQMLVMEKAILKKLKFRLNAPTPYVFMLRFLKAAQADIKLEHLAFYLIELCLVELEALKFKPSLLCASAIYVARCTLQMTPVWTPLLGKHARYEESQIRDCAEMILRFHKAAKTAVLNVTYEKYKKLEYSGVASTKPLDRLPL